MYIVYVGVCVCCVVMDGCCVGVCLLGVTCVGVELGVYLFAVWL